MNSRVRLFTAFLILFAMALAPASAGAAPPQGANARPSSQAACTNPQTIVSTGGIDDNFALPNQPELAAPSPALLAYMIATWGAKNINPHFDRPFKDRGFGHTFQVAQLPNLRVLSATLTIRARAFMSLTSNDGIGFFQPVNGVMTPVWGNSFAALSGLPWNAGDQALLTINLPQSVLDAIADGALDVIVEDDTTVDFMQLDVVVCWCLPGATLQGGLNDAFAAPTEPRVVSPGLNTWLVSRGVVGIRDFDQSTVDYWFGHTFSNVYPVGTGETRPICGASLEIHVQPDASTLASNDTIALTFVDPVTGADLVSPAPSWWAYFGTGNGAPNLGLGTWQSGGPPAVINLDLAALPNGGTNLLALMQQHGQLDVVVQDDTTVDYVTLTITE